VENITGYFAAAVIVIVLAIFIGAIRKNALKQSPLASRMNFVVCAPRSYKGVGITCSALFGVALVGSTIGMAGDPDYPWVACIFGGLLAMGLFILYYAYRWKLVVAEDAMALTPLFGQDRIYSIRDVTHIGMGIYSGVKVFSGRKRLFSVDRYSSGTAMFISYLIENGVKAPKKIII